MENGGQSELCDAIGTATLAVFPVIPLVPDKPDSFSENEEANVNISLTTAELLEKKSVPSGQPDDVPVVVGYADDGEDEENDDDGEDEEDLDDLDDDEDLDHDWEEVGDEEDDDDLDDLDDDDDEDDDDEDE